MNDDEKELVKVGAETAMKPFAELITKLFGGPVEQIGGMWTDGIVVRRQIRQIKLMKKLQKAIEDAGFEPKPIPDKIWIPALHEALLEDDEYLQETWAKLLANAADPRQTSSVLPAFTTILKDLTSREVKFLNKLYGVAKSPNFYKSDVESLFTEYELMQAYVDAGLTRLTRLSPLNVGDIERGGDDLKADRLDFALTLAMLIRLGLLRVTIETEPLDVSPITRERNPIPPHKLDVSVSMHYLLTELAVQFVCACQ